MEFDNLPPGTTVHNLFRWAEPLSNGPYTITFMGVTTADIAYKENRMPTPRVVAEYIGTDSAHLGNIPASDLNEEQMDALSEDQRTALLANAASEHAIYKLHGRDIKAEAKEIAAESEVQTVTMVNEPMTGGTVSIGGGPAVPVRSAAKADEKK